MEVVVVDAFEDENPISSTVKKMLEENNTSYTYFMLKNMVIHPCRGCGSCSTKIPGQCIFKDDMPVLLRNIVKSGLLIMLTPIRFGGYASQLKKFSDKCPLLCSPFLEVKSGHLYHTSRYRPTSIIGIGLNEKNDRKREENYKAVLSGNAFNMQSPYHKAIVLYPWDDTYEIGYVLRNTLKEVEKNE